MIKINNKKVNKIMINGKEVLKVIVNGNVKYNNNIWDPNKLVFDWGTTVTSTSVTSITASNNNYIFFIYPSRNLVYLNATSGKTYDAFLIIYDAANQSVILFNHDSSGNITTQGYTNVYRVALPGMNSSIQTNYGRHRFSRYINNSGKKLKWRLLNDFVYIANSAPQNEFVCLGENQNMDINLKLLDGVTNPGDYTNHTNFIVSPYLQSNNQVFITNVLGPGSNEIIGEQMLYAQKVSDTKYQLINIIVNNNNIKTTNVETKNVRDINTYGSPYNVEIKPQNIYKNTQTSQIIGKGVLVLQVSN